MKVIENFAYNGIIYKIGMDFLGNPTEELLPFLENSSSVIKNEEIVITDSESAEHLNNASEQINSSAETVPKSRKRNK